MGKINSISARPNTGPETPPARWEGRGGEDPSRVYTSRGWYLRGQGVIPRGSQGLGGTAMPGAGGLQGALTSAAA